MNNLLSSLCTAVMKRNVSSKRVKVQSLVCLYLANGSSKFRMKVFSSLYGVSYFSSKIEGHSPSTLSPSSSSSSSVSSSMLTDSFGRYHNYLRMSLTEKCNLRCVYCMPEAGVKLTEDNRLPTIVERKRMLSIFRRMGVDKIRFTGGEPTVSKHLVGLIEYCRNELNIETIGITTNGIIMLTQLDNLVKAGLTSVNISLDTLNEEKFATITRREKRNFARVMSAIYGSLARDIKVKVNCVLMRDINCEELAGFVALTKSNPLDVRFIEVMPFDDNNWNPLSLVSYLEAISRLADEGIILEPCRDASLHDHHDTTKWYRVQGHQGRIGFITSMSSHFCGGCNRLRITADGKLKVCLFGEESLSLTESLRENICDSELEQRISIAISRKKAILGGHSLPSDIAKTKNRPMILIGG